MPDDKYPHHTSHFAVYIALTYKTAFPMLHPIKRKFLSIINSIHLAEMTSLFFISSVPILQRVKRVALIGRVLSVRQENFSIAAI